MEVTFQRKRARTAVADGPNPTWNESLTLNVIPPKNNDSETLRQPLDSHDGVVDPEAIIEGQIATESVYFNVFDEVLVDLIVVS